MLRKTILVVGALVAATVASSGSADAAVRHRHFVHVRSYHRSASPRPLVARQARWRSPRGYGRHAFYRVRFESGPRRRHSRFIRTLWRHRRFIETPRSAAMIRRYVGPRSAFVMTRSYAGVGYRVETGRASFYGGGGRTASGGRVGAATCAHRTLPFGTRVLVTNLANAHRAVLTVNDRGPFVRGRIIDVSTGAAASLGMLGAGTASVRVEVVGGPG